MIAIAAAVAIFSLYGPTGIGESLWGLGILLGVVAGFAKIIGILRKLVPIFTGRMSLCDLRRR